MTRDEFEHRLLSLWMTTRLPLTRANLQFVTGVPRAKLGKWLDQLVADGVLDVDSDDEGELIWGVRGAARATSGATSPEEVKKLADLKREVASSTALVRAGAASLGLRDVAAGLTTSHGANQKSLIASGALSFFFGPIGWLYAAPLKEAGPVILGYLLLCLIMPHLLLVPLLGLINPLSAAIGVAYAWRHNQKGARTPFVLPDPNRALPPRR
ncbi:MAG: uncharacterized protein JWN44_520 [Myxococcales bacterium]|nr:uncharacterized protein [Myxococcales bacterium]